MIPSRGKELPRLDVSQDAAAARSLACNAFSDIIYLDTQTY